MSVERTVKIQVDGTQAVNSLKQVKSEIDVTYAELRRTTPVDISGSKATSVLKKVEKQADDAAKSTKDIGEGAEDSAKGWKVLTTATRSFGLALKATGIGLIVSAFVKLGEALGQNQVVMDKFNVVLEAVSITFQKIVNVVVDVAVKIGHLFKALKNITKAVFEANEGFKTLGVTQKDNNKSTETAIQRNVRLAKEIVKLRNEVKLAEAEQRRLQLTYQREAEIQRQIRDDVNLTIEERIAANQQLGNILDQQFAAEKALADKKLALAELELSKNKDNIDLQVAVINAQTELADLQERITGQRSEQLINETALQNEFIESQKEGVITLKATETEKLKITDNTNNELILGAKQTQEKLNEVEKTGAKKRIKIDRELLQERSSILRGALGQIGGLVNEESKKGKKVAKALAIIDTFAAANKALAQGGIFGVVAAAGVVASGIANVKAITAQKLPGGDDDGGGDTPSPTIPTPQGIGALTPNLEAIEQPELGGGQPTVQAFVVENDISNAQALQQELDVQATL